MHTSLRLASLLAVVACTPRLVLAEGGSLTPPAGPAPMMKTLSQIEPRTDIAELSSDATAVKVIPGPGHYYLTGDLAGASGKDSIRIATAGRVTIDLNGFSLTSVGSGRSGVLVPGANDMVVIRNGAILASGSSTLAVGGTGTHVVCEDLKIFSTGAQTLTLGADAVVSRCRIQGGGISAQARSVVRDTVIEGGSSDLMINLAGDDTRLSKVTFTAGTGTVSVGDRCEVSDCILNTGGPVGIFSTGAVFQAGAGCVLRQCSITAGTSTGSAIVVGSASLLSGCRVTSAFRDGISSSASNNVTVESCVFQNFGRGGIRLGTNARVRDCTVVGSSSGSTNGMELGDKAVVSGSSVADCGAIGISAGAGSVLSTCQSSGNAADGIVVGLGATLQNCGATSNLGRGIFTGEGATLTNCSAFSNQGTAGISCGFGCALTNCVARANTSSAASSFGIVVSGESTLIGCTVTNTASTAASLTATTGCGVSIAASSTVKDCTVQGNRGDGIRAGSLCQIIGNTCDGNGLSTGDGAGIHTTSIRNRIERNTATNNDRGIEVTSTASVIVGNTASTNTTNYAIAASNRYGAILDLTATGSAAVSGSSGAGTISTADSMANLSH